MAQSLWAENLTRLPCHCASELWPQGLLAAHLHVIIVGVRHRTNCTE